MRSDWQVTIDFLLTLARDPYFALEFHQIDGIKKLILMIQNGNFDVTTHSVCSVLYVFLEFMKHTNLIQWEDLPSEFVIKVVSHTNLKSKLEDNNLLRLSLNVLIPIMENPKAENLHKIIRNEISFTSLNRLFVRDDMVIYGVLKIMNLLIDKNNDEYKNEIFKEINTIDFRKEISNIIKIQKNKSDERILKELLELQQFYFWKAKNLSLRRPTTMEVERVVEMDEWKTNNTFDSSQNSLDILDKTSMKAIGPNSKTKFADFVTMTPPGSLVLDLILEYASQYGSRLNEVGFKIIKMIA